MELMELMYLILFITILGISVFKLFNLINKQFRKKLPEVDQVKVKPSKTDLTDIYKDISLEPYGCFSSLDEKFFLKQINPYSKESVLDSGIIISENTTTDDMNELIQQVMNNGFDIYANQMINKYGSDPDGYRKNMSIKEIGILGKLAGYNYLSVYKLNEKTRGKVYLSYSPPMDQDIPFNSSLDVYNKNLTTSDLPNYTLTPKLNNYTNEEEKASGKELSCGYPCLPNDKPMTFEENGVTKQYMCGSVGYPNIKTPTRFAVYHITEKV